MDLRDRIKELCKSKNISMNALETELGFGKGYISKLGKSTPNATKMQQIADYFGVTIDYLINGYENEKSPTLSPRDVKDIKSILENTEQLLKQDGLMFDGDPASPEAIDSILSAMKIGMEMAKQKNKEKYTPKKYKKE